MFSQTQRHVIFSVDENDEDRLNNCDRPLISKSTFQHNFKPQLPAHCVSLMQRLCPKHYQQQTEDEIKYVAEVPIKPFHLNSFVSVNQLETQRAQVDETQNYDPTLPNNLQYYEFCVPHIDVQNLDQQTKKKKAK
ncbi:Hypothetical_protein [Hexamita inflata]|uniref:Hypothetical_protein n=1 Tax=Hexamita inflata TaxID=28002 RepID=A0AA86NM50_9EUKA|nr:Hypothetical protein HINF_LOCUS9804 [Hexamita inflata]CAI9978078.1 Hypothetical protein HINF_LOCUS65723 [Hexamita inflata]